MAEAVVTSPTQTVAGLFAGIGGVELGLQRAGFESKLLCEWAAPAKAVLLDQFPGVDFHDNVKDLPSLPSVDVVTAGFPCTDLSQAGRTAGIHGTQSGLIKHLFKLLADTDPKWVVIENVRNMLALDKGLAMEYLVEEFETLGYRWAYRLVDSRFTGVPQRRHRVIVVASRTEDPRTVLFADDSTELPSSTYRDDAFGFYWTEGNTGLGWAKDAIPTLKGGSGLGIPSPPAIWIPGAPTGQAIVTPSISDAEELQGFPRDWTIAAKQDKGRTGDRWKLVGNAVTVGVAEWVGRRLQHPGMFDETGQVLLMKGMRWPNAAWGGPDERWEVPYGMWPERHPYRHILDLVKREDLAPLSLRATSGFYGRLQKSRLRYDEDFATALKAHIEISTPATTRRTSTAPNVEYVQNG
ncbi:DNA cytosine methyltransferase [Streptomyces sp. NPDC059916]|uniref:DNA cytosine methyltransferase n=1 Tax=Streptomyces sp. NPDC059916 TaxID=3347001 RepID=UPI00367AF839